MQKLLSRKRLKRIWKFDPLLLFAVEEYPPVHFCILEEKMHHFLGTTFSSVSVANFSVLKVFISFPEKFPQKLFLQETRVLTFYLKLAFSRKYESYFFKSWKH